MSQAETLEHLQIIRAHNRDYLDEINGNLGTALGFKKRTGVIDVSHEPAVLVFVPYKIKSKWLPKGKVILDKLQGPDGLWCPLDVIQSNIADEFTPIEDDPSEEVERLRGWDDKIWMGGQIAVNNSSGGFSLGTIGAFVKRNVGNEYGILTNKHVAKTPGTKIYFPVPWGLEFAETKESYEYIEDQDWYSAVNEPDTYVRIDCAYAKLTNLIDPGDIQNEFMTKGKLGPVLDIKLDSMEIIGQKVMRIGRTTGIRYGTVVAFGYEFIDDTRITAYSDLLIIGDNNIQFSTRGDSGSLIVTNDESRNPIGLLWGGYMSKLQSGKQQEDWTYGIALKRVLDKLQIQLIY